MNAFKSIFLSVGLFLIQMVGLLATEQKYQLIDLGLQKNAFSTATCINNKGWICGYFVKDSTSYMFVLDKEKKLATRKINTECPNLFINNYDEVYGSLIQRTQDYNWFFDEEIVFKWENPFKFFQFFQFHKLNCPSDNRAAAFDFKRNIVWGANDLGQLLILNKRTRNDAMEELAVPRTAMWIYDKKKFHKIDEGQITAGFKINNHSQILGGFYEGSSLYKNRKSFTSIYSYNDKTIQVLDLPGSSIGTDINDMGQVVGIFYNPDERMNMGFLYEASGEIIYLENFSPKAINNKNQIVGRFIYDKNAEEPAIFKDGILYDLMDLTSLVDDKGNVWESLDYLTDINDEGYIIGNGTIHGISHAFLLKPL